jgi:hypothetical protein
MDVVQAVIQVVREASELRKQVEGFEQMMSSMVGCTVMYSEGTGRKKKFYQCTVESWDGDSWELVEENPEDKNDPSVFVATFEDMVEGRMWMN